MSQSEHITIGYRRCLLSGSTRCALALHAVQYTLWHGMHSNSAMDVPHCEHMTIIAVSASGSTIA